MLHAVTSDVPSGFIRIAPAMSKDLGRLVLRCSRCVVPLFAVLGVCSLPGSRLMCSVLICYRMEKLIEALCVPVGGPQDALLGCALFDAGTECLAPCC